MSLIRLASDVPDLASLPPIPRGDRLLMASPEFFDVEYVINPHMAGNVGNVDRLLARQQWRALLHAYQAIGIAIDVLPGEPFLPDYVFTANQCLPVPPGLLADGPGAVLSIMASALRQAEIAPYRTALTGRGLHVESLDAFAVRSFEGTGDASWHPERALLLGGVGPRTSIAAYERISAWLGVPVVILDLGDPRFYHLDTCLCPIDARRALYFPDAFTAAGQALIQAVYPAAIPVSEVEAMNMACNAHSPDGHHVILQAGSPAAEAALEAAGLTVIAVETSEFLKSGGSVFCMKLQYWSP